MIGKKLGHYEIIEQIGAGGMGEVYRARDVRLDRIVAVKVLPSHFAEDPERRQRFEREARTISSLSHPNICTLHDLGHENGTHYIVMEYLEGETLSERLHGGPLPMNEVLRFGAAIAEALDRAHRAGIVHRDLKPGNVMLTPDGVKLLDFGLAKATDRVDNSSSLIVTQPGTEASPDTPLTAEGTILGTFQYMAPEQLEGAEADNRSDIFAFGSVLYEMATGRKAFQGKSQASLIASILEREPPPISSVHALTPPAFDHVVGKCLAKNPDDRWQSAQDIAGQLRWVAEESSRAGVPKVVSVRRKNRERLAWGVAAVATLAAAAAVALWAVDRPPPPEVSRFEIPIPDGVRFANRPRISPDGRHMAFTVWNPAPSIWIRSLDALEARPVPGTEGADWCFWSPDGRHLAFMEGGKLRKVAVSGGPAQTVGDAPRGDDGSWTESGDILFDGNMEDGISRVVSSGGVPQPVAVADSANPAAYGWPEALPSGRHFLCLEIDVDQDTGEFPARQLRSRVRRCEELGHGGIARTLRGPWLPALGDGRDARSAAFRREAPGVHRGTGAVGRGDRREPVRRDAVLGLPERNARLSNARRCPGAARLERSKRKGDDGGQRAGTLRFAASFPGRRTDRGGPDGSGNRPRGRLDSGHQTRNRLARHVSVEGPRRSPSGLPTAGGSHSRRWVRPAGISSGLRPAGSGSPTRSPTSTVTWARRTGPGTGA